MHYENIYKFNSPNFTWAESTAAAFGYSRSLDYIVIHHWGDPAGQPQFNNVVNWLCNPASGVSAHAVVEAGKVAWLVNCEDAAWHAGNAQANAKSIGLELNPRAAQSDYQTAALLIAQLRYLYGDIPLYPHNRFTSTACPGAWDLSKLDRMARELNQAVFQAKGEQPPRNAPTAPQEAHVMVAKGDTLSSIARKNNTQVDTIIKLNNIQNKNLIFPGQTLRVR